MSYKVSKYKVSKKLKGQRPNPPVPTVPELIKWAKTEADYFTRIGFTEPAARFREIVNQLEQKAATQKA